jgi:uncharacterized protein with PhoU and TrkA domain
VDDKRKSLRAMLADAKDTSELMVDLAYAAVLFGDPGMADEVQHLEARLNELTFEMRAVCIMAGRRPAEAEAMASVLQIVSAIEGIGNSAIDIIRIVTHKLGLPPELIADLAEAEEVSHRVWVRDGSHMARRPLADLELPVATGMRVIAMRRGRSWINAIDGDQILQPGDVLFLRGSPAGIARLHELAAAPQWDPPLVPDSHVLSDLDRAVDVLVDMKDLSEAAVGLAYSALALRDSGLASEVAQLAERLDGMKDRLQIWVLRAGAKDIDPSPLRGLLQLSQAAEEIGDQASQMTWLLSDDREYHPIVGIALGDSDEVAVRMPVREGSTVDGSTLVELQLDIEPGFHVLAVRRGGRYLYQPRGTLRLVADDELIATGPDEGRGRLAQLCGWLLTEGDDEQAEPELVPLGIPADN